MNTCLLRNVEFRTAIASACVAVLLNSNAWGQERTVVRNGNVGGSSAIGQSLLLQKATPQLQTLQTSQGTNPTAAKTTVLVTPTPAGKPQVSPPVPPATNVQTVVQQPGGATAASSRVGSSEVSVPLSSKEIATSANLANQASKNSTPSINVIQPRSPAITGTALQSSTPPPARLGGNVPGDAVRQPGVSAGARQLQIVPPAAVGGSTLSPLNPGERGGGTGTMQFRIIQADPQAKPEAQPGTPRLDAKALRRGPSSDPQANPEAQPGTPGLDSKALRRGPSSDPAAGDTGGSSPVAQIPEVLPDGQSGEKGDRATVTASTATGADSTSARPSVVGQSLTELADLGRGSATNGAAIDVFCNSTYVAGAAIGAEASYPGLSASGVGRSQLSCGGARRP